MRLLIYAALFALVAASAALGYQQRRELIDARDRLEAMDGGPVDVGFAQFMGVHHHQAVMMAQLLLDGRPSKLTSLARQISNSQLLEIGQMRGWLQIWGQPELPSTTAMDWMLLGHEPPDESLQRYLLECQRSARGMPGLASIEQLNELRRLDGDERDRLFLQLMLAHHQGGLPMARFAAQNARVPAARHLADRIVLAQAEEITSMRMMLGILESSSSSGAGMGAQDGAQQAN